MALFPNRSAADPEFAIRMVDDCLSAALERGASDVHFQPRRDRWEIAFRIDGVLRPAEALARSAHSDPVSRLMAMADLPSYRSGIPQEGRIQWRASDGATREMRLGIFPTADGNRAVVRIMDDRASIRELSELGFGDDLRQRLISVCDARDGWLLVAGPTGSGKTTTLYACLTYIASGQFQRSVLTMEDPIESLIDGISQSQLDSSSGLTLASALRAAVRQDAEVLLVSEIRDVETAESVLAASMTGSLCFSSIHAGSIGATLRRLVQMRLPTFAIESGLRGVLCQRLLRRSCQICSSGTSDDPDPSCQQCHGTGYHGRIPIAQLVTFDGGRTGQSVFDALANQRAATEIDAVIRQAGEATLMDQAQQLIAEGRTTAAEVFRVLGHHQTSPAP